MSDTILEDMYEVILDRKQNPMEGSYTCYLFEKGLDKYPQEGRGGERRNHYRGQERCA